MCVFANPCILAWKSSLLGYYFRLTEFVVRRCPLSVKAVSIVVCVRGVKESEKEKTKKGFLQAVVQPAGV